jgi:hypothetical protein
MSVLFWSYLSFNLIPPLGQNGHRDGGANGRN